MTTNDVDSTYKALIEYSFMTDHPEEENLWQRLARRGSTSTGKSDKLFDKAEINRVIYKMKVKKAPGSDGLPIEIIRDIFMANNRLFIHILNSCLKKASSQDSERQQI